MNSSTTKACIIGAGGASRWYWSLFPRHLERSGAVTDDKRLERIEKRLDEIAGMLKELVEMARRDWEIYQAALNSAPAAGYEQTTKARKSACRLRTTSACAAGLRTVTANASPVSLKSKSGRK